MPHLQPRRAAAGDADALKLLLIFVLAVVLTALLLPRYRSYTLNEHSRLAAAALQEVLLQQHTWQATHPAQRLPSLQSLGYEAMAIYVSSDGDVRSNASINSIYRISLTAPEAPSVANCGLVADDAATGFVLVAEPVQTQRIDTECGRLCLSSSGRRGSTGSAATAECWSRR